MKLNEKNRVFDLEIKTQKKNNFAHFHLMALQNHFYFCDTSLDLPNVHRTHLKCTMRTNELHCYCEFNFLVFRKPKTLKIYARMYNHNKERDTSMNGWDIESICLRSNAMHTNIQRSNEMLCIVIVFGNVLVQKILETENDIEWLCNRHCKRRIHCVVSA